MPNSSRYGKVYTSLMVHKLGEAGLIRHIVDGGCGAGTYRTQLGPMLPGTRWTGIEAWEPYVERFRLNELYDTILVADLREVDFATLGPVDLVLFGDVLEHMTRDEAKSVVERALSAAPYVMISIPVIRYPQGEIEGNPFEAHVKDDWDHSQVLQSFAGIAAFLVHDHIGVYFLASTANAAANLGRLSQVIPGLVHGRCPDDLMIWGHWQVFATPNAVEQGLN